MFAHSDQLDRWMEDGSLRQISATDRLSDNQRSRDLVAQVRQSRDVLHQNREILHHNMEELRKTIVAIRKCAPPL